MKATLFPAKRLPASPGSKKTVTHKLPEALEYWIPSQQDVLSYLSAENALEQYAPDSDEAKDTAFLPYKNELTQWLAEAVNQKAMTKVKAQFSVTGDTVDTLTLSIDGDIPTDIAELIAKSEDRGQFFTQRSEFLTAIEPWILANVPKPERMIAVLNKKTLEKIPLAFYPFIAQTLESFVETLEDEGEQYSSYLNNMATKLALEEEDDEFDFSDLPS